MIKIYREPYNAYGKWFVECQVTAYGRESDSTRMFDTEEQAKALKVGDTVQI